MDSLQFRIGTPEDFDLILNSPNELFDEKVNPILLNEFLNDPRHHIAIAENHNSVIGFASGVHYLHPDKKSEMFINEVGVVQDLQGKGIGREIVTHLTRHAYKIGCTCCWVLTSPDNMAAKKCYANAGGTEEEKNILFNFLP